MDRNENSFLSREELESCSFIKTVLMLVVVVYHSILFWNGTWYTQNPEFEAVHLARVARWMNSFHIYAFTLVSGYIFYHVKFGAGRYRQYKPFLINKAKRLLIPYVAVAALWVIPFHCWFIKISITDIIKKYVLGTSPSQLWFLLMLFGVFAIMWPLSDFLCKHTVAGSIIVVGLYFLGITGQKILPNIFQIWITCRYCLYFWLGMKLRQYTESHGISILRRIPAWLWLVADIALYVGVNRIPKSNALLALMGNGLACMLQIFGALMAFAVLGKISEIVPWKKSKLFLLLSKYSFPIYLFHQQLVYCAIELLNGKVNPYINALINILVAFFGSLLISWILMKFRVTRMMIGEKK